MKLPALKSRDARALRLGGMILAPFVLYFGVLAPAYRSITSDRDAVAKEQHELDAERALVSRARNVGTVQTQTTTWLAREARRLFTGHDEVAATSELGDYVLAAATNAGLQVQHSETRPAVVVSGPLRAVRLDLRGQGTAHAVLMFVQSLENGGRLVRVGRLLVGRGGAMQSIQIGPGMRLNGMQITSPTPEAASSAAASTDPQLSQLSITAEVYGYALLPPPPGVRVLTDELGAPYAPLSGPGITLVSLPDALTHNPFSVDRDATDRPPPPVTRVARASGRPAFPISLVGTVVSDADNSFAMCAIQGATPEAVRTGDHIVGYTVRGIERGGIVLVSDAGRTVHLTLPTPGA